MKFTLDKDTELIIMNGYHGLDVEIDMSHNNIEEVLTNILAEHGLNAVLRLLDEDDNNTLFDYLETNGSLHDMLISAGYIFNKG